MPARTPEEMHQVFAEALNAGDMDSLLALYEPGATLIPQPGQLVTGLQGIRQALSAFLAAKPRITVETQKVIRAGEVALLYSRWALKGMGPDGKAFDLTGEGTEVGRQQPDGTWRFVIDNPYVIE